MSLTQYYLQERSVVDEVCLYDHGLSHNILSVVDEVCLISWSLTKYYLQERSVVDEVCLYDHGLSHNITYKRISC